MSILKRLERVEGAFADRATVLRLAGGRKAFLPFGAVIDVVFGFMNVMHSDYDSDTFDGTLSWRGKPVPLEWVEAFANSIPEPDEGTATESARELSRRYLAGEDLSDDR